jgi:hypothetical protein
VTDIPLVDLGSIAAFLVTGAYIARLGAGIISDAIGLARNVRSIKVVISWRNET